MPRQTLLLRACVHLINLPGLVELLRSRLPLYSMLDDMYRASVNNSKLRAFNEEHMLILPQCPP